MKKSLLGLPLLLLSVVISTAANAGLIGVEKIVVKNAVPTYLQVAEVVASGAGTDWALSTNGATASGTGSWNGNSTPDKAIDGNLAATFPSMYHSDGNGANEALTINLAGPKDIDVFSIYGRIGCCGNQDRDIYNVSFFDAVGTLLFEALSLDANAYNGHVATIDFGSQPTAVAEPASIALLGFGLLGLGIARRNSRHTS